jgi:hypothetical protein
VRRQLSTFLAGWERWPSYPESQMHGRGLLYNELVRHGDPRAWAALFDLPYVHPLPPGWSEVRIRAELEAYLAGRTVFWPSGPQFGADRRHALRDTIAATGGGENPEPVLAV